ncbi:MAG: hypothetical protein NTW07_00460 [candidate division Zixibacteria bacterium]|nr:hypothetical protein [candidate division Zixibacteria bacterium]
MERKSHHGSRDTRPISRLVPLSVLLLTAAVMGAEQPPCSAEVGEIVAQIEEINMVQGSAIGYSGERPKQWDNFTELKAAATVDELRTLTDHPSGVVRCYAFWALAYADSVDLYPIVRNHLSDTGSVTFQFGCTIDVQRAGDFFIELATPEYIDVEVGKLGSAQLWTLDSILIFGSHGLYARDRAIDAVQPVEYLYPRLRELVVRENNASALVALARYRKGQDIELVLTSPVEDWFAQDPRRYRFKAISYFPHPDFLPMIRAALEETLKEETYSSWWGDMYKAIASYENDEAVQLLEKSFTEVEHKNMRKYHLGYAFAAVREHKVPIFDRLFWRFCKDEKRMSPDVFEYLRGRNPDALYEVVKATLWHLQSFYDINRSYELADTSGSEDAVASMLHMVLERDSAEASRLIVHNTKVADVFMFPIFADAAAQIRSPGFVDALLSRLETENNPYVYLKAAEALIAYDDTAINGRVLEARRLNPALSEGWGGTALSRLLKDHGLQ